jgi:hypothetical protein
MNTLTTPEKSWVEIQMIEADKKWQKMQQANLDELYLKFLAKGLKNERAS